MDVLHIDVILYMTRFLSPVDILALKCVNTYFYKSIYINENDLFKFKFMLRCHKCNLLKPKWIQVFCTCFDDMCFTNYCFECTHTNWCFKKKFFECVLHTLRSTTPESLQ